MACVFTLPLESEGEEQIISDEATLLNVDSDVDDKVVQSPPQGQKKRQRAPTIQAVTKKPPKVNRFKFTWRMIRWHILLFLALSIWLYAIFIAAFTEEQKEIVLRALEFLDEWKQMAFFLGIYISFAVKKVSDVSSVSWI